MVIVFTKRNDASELLLAAQNISGEALQLIWIGSDGWTGQIPMEKKALLDSTVDGKKHVCYCTSERFSGKAEVKTLRSNIDSIVLRFEESSHM